MGACSFLFAAVVCQLLKGGIVVSKTGEMAEDRRFFDKRRLPPALRKGA